MSKEQIAKLECTLMTMGMNGMAYTPHWNKVAKELNKLKDSEEVNKAKVEEESKIREALVTKPLSEFDKEILINKKKELQE